MSTENAFDWMAEAKRLEVRGNEVIERLGLLRHWREIGMVFEVGSHRFGLMTRPNLDFEIYTEAPEPRQGFAAIREIAAVPGVLGVEYRNFMDTPDPGLYWRVDYRDEEGRTWDADLWLVPWTHPCAGMADRLAQAMNEALTPETRLAILALKHARDPEKPLRGIDIYKAVLQGGVRNPQELAEYLRRNPPLDLETWNPKGSFRRA